MSPELPPFSGAPPIAQPVLAPGLRLGRYELVRRLAVGGMADIFLARAEGPADFEKLVVLKSILAQHAADDDWVQMFLQEARLAATLQHPNIVQVFDFGRIHDVHFFTMEYVRGADLRRIMKRAARAGGVPLEVALAIVAGAAAGLHHAHEKTDADGRPLGIVHRDVSPANVLVSSDGAVKILDFGIAKAAMRRAATRTGTIKGKAGWISPEQCRGEALDRRSDVFSLGVLLYELTTGSPPFSGENEYAILKQVAEQDAPPPSTVRPAYPPALEAIVMRCLRRDRSARYATAQELQIDLETFARDQDLVLSSVEIARFMEELDARDGGEPQGPATRVGAPLIALPRSLTRRARRAAAGVLAAAVAVAGALYLRAPSPSPTSAAPAPIAPIAPVAAPPPAPSTAVVLETHQAERAGASALGRVVVDGDEPRRRKSAAKRRRARAAEAAVAARRNVRVKATRPETDLDAPFPR